MLAKVLDYLPVKDAWDLRSARTNSLLVFQAAFHMRLHRGGGTESTATKHAMVTHTSGRVVRPLLLDLGIGPLWPLWLAFAWLKAHFTWFWVILG
jgi:hypothetical protein